MPGFYAPQLPGYQLGRGVDFSILNEGLDALSKTIEKNRLLAEQKELASGLGKTSPQVSASGPQYAPTNRLLSNSSPAQYGASNVVDQIVGAESSGNATLRNPRSSATGAGQFINSTWLETIKRARPDLAQGKSDQELLALRNDPNLSREMTGVYANQNAEALRGGGYEASPGNTYLAHFAGPAGAKAVLGADPSTPVRAVLGDRVVQANPFLGNMTAGDLRSWADQKMGGGSAPSPQPQFQSASAPRSRLNYAEGIRVAASQGNVDAMLKLQALERDEEQDVYTRQRQSTLDARQGELQGIQIQAARQELETAAQKRLAGIAQTIEGQTDPARRQAMWDKFIAVNPRIASTLQQYGIDPKDHAAGSALIISEARGLQEPKASDITTFKGDEGIIQRGPDGVKVLREPSAGSGKVVEVNGRVVQQQPDGSFKEVYAAPPKAKNLTVQEQKEVFEADEGVQAASNVIGALNKALELNGQAYSGPLAQTRGYTTSLFGSEGGAATEELQNVVLQQVLDNLKATFGAAPTEGERQILVDIQGSVSKAPEVRRRIFENAIAAAERRRIFNQTKAGAIRGGEYFQPGYQPSAVAPNTPPAVPAANAGAVPPPAPAIQFLKSNPTPEIIAQFDAKYGPGAAQQVLSQIPGAQAPQADPSQFGVSP